MDHLNGGEGPANPSSIPCGPRLGPSWAKLGPGWAPVGHDWGPFGNAAWEVPANQSLPSCAPNPFLKASV